MIRLPVDAAVEQEFQRLAAVAAICDWAGREIGYCQPRQVRQHLLDLTDVPVEEFADRGRQRTGLACVGKPDSGCMKVNAPVEGVNFDVATTAETAKLLGISRNTSRSKAD